MKVALTDEQIKRFEAGMTRAEESKMVEDIVRVVAPDHIGYGIKFPGVVKTDGIYYAVWDIFDSCE